LLLSGAAISKSIPHNINEDPRIRGVKGSSEMLKNYKGLKAWQKSYAFCLRVYKITATCPKQERCGITSQIRRSAVSIPSNIAQGYGRKTTADYIRMLYISYGSLCELETQLLLTEDLGFIRKGEMDATKQNLAEVEQMLKVLIKTLETKHLNP
jgi:four helix bundle protein